MSRKTKLAILISILLFSTILFLLLQADPSAKFNEKVKPTSPRTVSYILIDGLNSDLFFKELYLGNLPNLSKIIKRSTLIKNGIGSFPSMTGYAFYPFLTGIDPTKSGILGLRWFDRKRDRGQLRNYVGRTNIWMNKDINDSILTVFDKSKMEYTASINTYMNRNVRHGLMTGWAHTTAKYHNNSIFPYLRKIPGIGQKIAKDHFQHETLVTELAIAQLQRNPKVQWITYPSLDAHNHVNGTDQTYIDLLKHIDHEIGNYWDAIHQLKQTDRMLVIVSDHGVVDVTKNVDVIEHLKMKGISLERGKATHIYSKSLNAEISSYQDKDGYYVINGNLSAGIYLKNTAYKDTKAWHEPLRHEDITSYTLNGINIPSVLSELEGINIVSYQQTDSTVVILKEGRQVIIKRTDSLYQYKYNEIDPFNYGINSGSIFSEAQFTSATYTHDYPSAITKIYNYMVQENAPDILMTSRAGYDLAFDYEIFVKNYKGGHGGIHKDQINVPYIIYHPEIYVDSLEYARSEDVGATVWHYLFESLNKESDGKSLFMVN